MLLIGFLAVARNKTNKRGMKKQEKGRGPNTSFGVAFLEICPSMIRIPNGMIKR
jgi:hypothetical protein